MLLVPGFLMVSTIRFRSVKAMDVGWRRSPVLLLIGAVIIAAIASHPRIALVVMSYSYVLAALIVFVYARVRRRPPPADPPATDKQG
jgi:phosphatidylserine synthase